MLTIVRCRRRVAASLVSRYLESTHSDHACLHTIAKQYHKSQHDTAFQIPRYLYLYITRDLQPMSRREGHNLSDRQRIESCGF